MIFNSLFKQSCASSRTCLYVPFIWAICIQIQAPIWQLSHENWIPRRFQLLEFNMFMFLRKHWCHTISKLVLPISLLMLPMLHLCANKSLNNVTKTSFALLNNFTKTTFAPLNKLTKTTFAPLNNFTKTTDMIHWFLPEAQEYFS